MLLKNKSEQIDWFWQPPIYSLKSRVAPLWSFSLRIHVHRHQWQCFRLFQVFVFPWTRVSCPSYVLVAVPQVYRRIRPHLGHVLVREQEQSSEALSVPPSRETSQCGRDCRIHCALVAPIAMMVISHSAFSQRPWCAIIALRVVTAVCWLLVFKSWPHTGNKVRVSLPKCPLLNEADRAVIAECRVTVSLGPHWALDLLAEV